MPRPGKTENTKVHLKLNQKTQVRKTAVNEQAGESANGPRQSSLQQLLKWFLAAFQVTTNPPPLQNIYCFDIVLESENTISS